MEMKSGRIVYKTYPDMELAFYLEQPRVRKYDLAPVVMNNVGGGWTHYEVLDAPYYSFRGQDKLLDEGFAILTVSHKGGNHGSRMGDLLGDLVDALAYIYQRNDMFGLDFDRIVPIGHSAGGHVSLMLTMAPFELLTANCVNMTEGFHYKAIGCVSMVGPTILYPDPESGRMLFPNAYNGTFTLKHLFGTEDYSEECYKTYSPITYARAGLPPMLLISGEKDTLVEPRQHELLDRALTEAGVHSEYLLVMNGDHSFLPVDGEMKPSRAEIDRRMYDFIRGLVG